MEFLYETFVFGSTKIKDLIEYCKTLKNIIAQVKIIAFLLLKLLLSIETITFIKN